MIVVDTNVFSELMRSEPDRRVISWYQHSDIVPQLAITAISVAELFAGIETMDDGQRRRLLADRTESALSDQYGRSVLPFDATAARAYALIRGVRRRAGLPISAFEAQIAAVCMAHDATLATRNVRDFAGCGIRVVNPWEA
jgi:predicted nucleic acid-binding protein